MIRRIFLDGGRYASCEVENYGENDVYLFSSVVDLEEVEKTMRTNGFYVKGIRVEEGALVVDRTKFFFNGEIYSLNQCSDIFDWFGESQVGDFTYYYDRVVFHASKGHYFAAYIDDITNYIEV